MPLFTDHRVLSQVAGHGLNVIKGLPPLVLSEDDVDWFVAALDATLAAAQRAAARDRAVRAEGGQRRRAPLSNGVRHRPAAGLRRAGLVLVPLGRRGVATGYKIPALMDVLACESTGTKLSRFSLDRTGV